MQQHVKKPQARLLVKITNPLQDFPREVKVLVVASFFVAVGFGIVLPAIPVFARTFNANNAAVGLIVSAFAITRFASGLISGKLVDRFGERFVFTSGVGMVAIFVGLAGISQSYHQLLFFRAAGGLGSSMFSIAASSVIMRSVDDEHRGRALSVYNGSFLIGAVAGPAIGGVLSVISLRAPFFIYSAMLLISGTIALFFLKSSRGAENSIASPALHMTGIREALALRPYRIALVISFLTTWVLFGLRSSILPLFVIEKLHSTTAVIGYGFTISALFQGFLLMRGGRLSDIKGRRYAAITGTSVIMLGVITLIFTMNPLTYFMAMAIFGIGGAFIAAVPASIVGDLIDGKGGQVIAIFQMAGDAGMMIGPIAVGLISDHFGFRASFIVTAVVFSWAIVLAIKLPETRKSHLGQSAITSEISSSD